MGGGRAILDEMMLAMDSGGGGRGGPGALLQALLDNVEGGAGGIGDHGPGGPLESMDLGLGLSLPADGGSLGRDADRRAAEALAADAVAASTGRLVGAVAGGSASAERGTAALPSAAAAAGGAATRADTAAHDRGPLATPGASSAVLDSRYLSMMGSTGDALPGCSMDFSAMDYGGWASTPKASTDGLPVTGGRGGAADRVAGGVAAAAPPLFLMDDLAAGTDGGSPVSRTADEAAAERREGGEPQTAAAGDETVSSTSASVDGLYEVAKEGESFSCSLLDSSAYGPDELSIADATCRSGTLVALLPGGGATVAPGATPPIKSRPLAGPLAAAVASSMGGVGGQATAGAMPPSSPILSTMAGSAGTPTLAGGSPRGGSGTVAAHSAADAASAAASAPGGGGAPHLPLSPTEGAVRSAATATARASAAGRLRAKRARARTHAGNAVRYSVRKRIADVRPRVNGRFATKSELAKAKLGAPLGAPDDPTTNGPLPPPPPPTGVVVAKVE